MRIYKSKAFAKFAVKEGISDTKLFEAVNDAEAGLIDADYGGGLIKQRMARLHEGKSGGYRTIIVLQRGKRAFFLYGFLKSQKDNIDESDKRDFKELAKILLSASEEKLERLVQNGEFLEVHHDYKESSLQKRC